MAALGELQVVVDGDTGGSVGWVAVALRPSNFDPQGDTDAT